MLVTKPLRRIPHFVSNNHVQSYSISKTTDKLVLFILCLRPENAPRSIQTVIHGLSRKPINTIKITVT